MIDKKEYQYKKAGVIVTRIVPSHQVQADLFDVVDRKRSQKAMKVLDFLNQRYGYNTVKLRRRGLRKAGK